MFIYEKRESLLYLNNIYTIYFSFLNNFFNDLMLELLRKQQSPFY